MLLAISEINSDPFFLIQSCCKDMSDAKLASHQKQSSCLHVSQQEIASLVVVRN
jgi:hypothetical protein